MSKMIGEIDRYYELYLYKRDPKIKAERMKYKTESEVELAKTELKKNYVYCEIFMFVKIDENKALGKKNNKEKIIESRFKLASEGVLQGWKDEYI
jgi:hypothetical protein